MSKLFTNKKVWSQFTETEMEQYIQDVFNHYRYSGFPFFPTDKGFRDKEFAKLMRYDTSGLIESDIIKQTMHGLSLAWSYMPHSWTIPCNGLKTPMEVFQSDDDLIKVIRKRIKMGDNMSDNGLRKMMKMYSGTQSVSNFRPTAAAALYQKYTERGDTVLDMSMGFGGRLLGAIKAGVNYIGTDPSTKTYNGLQQMYGDYGLNAIEAVLYNVGSEDLHLESESVDFAFTSPPYFNTEVYSDEPTQSCNKFTTQQEWLRGFLIPTLANTHHALKSGKYMLINVANVKGYKELETDTVKAAQQVGFKYEGMLRLALSNSNMSKGKSAFKYEPVFIFKK